MSGRLYAPGFFSLGLWESRSFSRTGFRLCEQMAHSKGVLKEFLPTHEQHALIEDENLSSGEAFKNLHFNRVGNFQDRLLGFGARKFEQANLPKFKCPRVTQVERASLL